MLCLGLASVAQQKIIFDTDMSGDSDDTGALAVLHALQDLGECEIIGVAMNHPDKESCGAADVINTYYGRGDIPIGIVKETGQHEGRERYTGTLVREFPFDYDWRKGQDAVDLYRELLGKASDRSIKIVSVGYLSNLGRLLDSPPDRHSPLNGEELVAAKVDELVVMGGAYPSGRESNFHNAWYRDQAHRVVYGWTAPVTYTGYEIGVDIRTGPRLWTETDERNPVRRAYQLYRGWTDRRQPSSASWDQTACLYAVRGAGNRWRLENRGSNTYASNGANAWVSNPDPRGRLEQAYFVKLAPNEVVAKEIEDLMVAAPRLASRPPTAGYEYVVQGLKVDFDGSSSTDNDQVVEYTWDFGDGNSGSGKKVQHTYAVSGVYTVKLTVTDNRGLKDNVSKSVMVDDGVTENTPNPLLNLALLPNAHLSGSVSAGRGTPRDILYDPGKGDYVETTEWNEYGVNFRQNMGKPNVEDGFYWQVEWPSAKSVNYITFGGTYENQRQPKTRWRISYKTGSSWVTLEEGQGGWIDSGIYEWGGETQSPLKMNALRVQAFSDGVNEVKSIHLRGRGGTSHGVNDSNTTPKACLIQFIGDHDPGGGTPPPTVAELSHWRFDEGAGADVADLVGGHDGQLKGAANTAWVDGVQGKALQFGATGQWVDIPAHDDFSLKEITIAGWIKPAQAVGGWRAIVEHDRSGSNWYGLFMRDGGAGLHFRWSRRQTLHGVQQLQAGRWYHVAATYEDATNTAKIYIDGRLDASKTASGMTPKLAPLRFGANLEGNEVFPGSLDEVRVFSKALSEAEIRALAEDTSNAANRKTGDLTTSAGDTKRNIATTGLSSTKINIYPNPAGNVLNVHFHPGHDTAQLRRLVIYSLQGREVLSRDMANEEQDLVLDVSKLTKGIYMLKVHSGAETQLFKIMKE